MCYYEIAGTENDAKYAPGGYHPVLIGDIFHDRYRVVHKLGHGGFSTVWLARDEEKNRYVALKILVASCESSELPILRHLLASSDPRRRYIVSLFDAFFISGPNGSHQCLVTEVTGPNLRDILEQEKPSLAVGKKIASQIIDGLAFLHSCHIGHGDFHPGNIVVDTPDIAGWSVEKVYRVLGNPDMIPIRKFRDGIHLTPSAPSYLVPPVSFWRMLQGCAFDVKILDFGQSFFESQPPDHLGTLLTYAAPEVLLGQNITSSVDLWGLGCILYAILRSSDLHITFFPDRDDILRQFVLLYGKFPDEWWSSWEPRSLYYNEDGTWKEPRAIDPSLKARLGRIRRDDPEEQKEIELHLSKLEALFTGLLRYEPERRLQASDVTLPF